MNANKRYFANSNLMNKDISFSEISSGLKLDLQSQNIFEYTEIQEKVIPFLLSTSSSVLALAPTGSGKTLAYLLPILTELERNSSYRSLIVLPTRDLAIQVYKIASSYCEKLGYSSALLVGGTSVIQNVRSLEKNPRLIIGTPGRIIFHLGYLKKISISALVLDEADRLLGEDFKKECKVFMQTCASSRKIFFSATMPEALKVFVSRFMLEVIDISKPKHESNLISEAFIEVQESQKFSVLVKHLSHKATVLVFVNSKYFAESLSKKVNHLGFKASAFSSRHSVNKRKAILNQFNKAQGYCLVATDIAARGIDFKALDLVVNYHVPYTPSDYVHRIGRAGRAFTPGKALTLVSKDQQRYMKNIDSFRSTNRQIIESKVTKKRR